MPHLLFLAERFPPDIGGVARSADRLTHGLCQLGLTVDVLVWSRYLQPGEVLPPDPAIASNPHMPQVYRVGLYRHWDMSMPHTLNVLDWLHQQHPYDAVWGHYLFPSGFLATWFAALQGIPSTVSVRGNDLDRDLFPPGDLARLQWTLERASLITTVSQDLAHKTRCLTGREDVLVIQNAVDTAHFTPPAPETNLAALKASLGIQPEEVVLGFAGELREKKGQGFLLKALATVREQRPACLLVIGEIRANQESVLQTFAAQHPEAARRVIVTGHLTDLTAIAQHLQLCDLYLQPSLWEGLPNALLEAMACERCAIASDAGGIPDVISSGENGYLLSRHQLHQLGHAVLECLEYSPAERVQIGKAARQRVLAEYSLQREQERLQTVIDRLMPKL